MQTKQKIFGITTISNNYDRVLKINIEIYKKIYKEFGNFYILNLSNFIIYGKKDKSVEKKNFFFSKNIKVFKPKNKSELISFFENKTFIAFNNLGKSFSNFKIYYYLKKIDIKQILLMNYGHINNAIEIYRENNAGFSNATGKIYFVRKKISYYLFRILTIFNIFPKIDIYFESSKDIYSSINKGNGISKKIENLFPFAKITYFRNTYKINSRSFDIFKKNKKSSSKYICFVDSNIENLDVTMREGKITSLMKKKYYLYLKNLFNYFNQIFKKKVVICLHPKNNDKTIYNFFKDFKIIKYKTPEIIRNSYIVLFHDSSAALDAILFKKNMICLKSEILGNYWNDRIDQYTNKLGLPFINLGKNYFINKSQLLKKFSSSEIKQKKYALNNLQIDNNKLGENKIIEVIKQMYFN